MKDYKTIIITSSVTMFVVAVIFGFIHFQSQDSYSSSENNAPYIIVPSKETDVIDKEIREKLNDDIYSSRTNLITKTVEKISPAIVGINVIEIREYRDPFFNDPFFNQFNVPTYRQKVQGLGSGFLISADGYIVTNHHVAGNAIKIVVTTTDGKQHDAQVIGTDKVSDICLLKIEGDRFSYVKFGNSDDVIIGEWAIAFGNPFGLFDVNIKPTVTVGVVSATKMNLGIQSQSSFIDMIQTDAAINSGNSGGPLVNSVGEVIGMNTIIYTAGSSGNIGVGFAIPSNKIKKIIAELKEEGKIERDFWTGIRIQPIDEGIAKYYKLPNTRGVIITSVDKKSPADKAGLKVEDIILEVDNYQIIDDKTIIGVIQEYKAGDIITFKIKRGEEIFTTKMLLEKK
ncbi:MAG: trypsin-like peptidase domain-containing protein [Ignavibacteriales bacterium]|nr:trypsin-like peptidase domain-containing protein [Ignavibacteriales bacterium]